MDDFREKLLVAFKDESYERMKVLSGALKGIDSDNSPDTRAKNIELAFREIHSLKGASGAVGLLDVMDYCQHYESFFSIVNEKGLPDNNKIFSLMSSWLDVLDDLLHIEELKTGSRTDITRNLAVSQMKKVVASFSDGNESADLSEEPKLHIAAEKIVDNHEKKENLSRKDVSSIRVSFPLLTGLLLQAEELLSLRSGQGLRTSSVVKIGQDAKALTKQLTSVNDLLRDNKVEEAKELIESGISAVEDLDENINSLVLKARRANWEISSKVDSLLTGFKESMLAPFSYMLDDFEGILRRLCADENKECSFEVEGGHITIDRRILDILYDPFLHILRNGIDHGIEPPAEREANNKPRSGTIKISISRLDGEVIRILYTDDGAGIDLEELKTRVVKNNLISEDELSSIDKSGLLNLIFLSGVSTAKKVTSLSGRGLGMAIVRDVIESLGGNISAVTPKKKGLRLVMTLPVTLTSFTGVVVKSNLNTVIVPKSVVRRVVLVRRDNIHISSGTEYIKFKDKHVPLISLADILEFPHLENDKNSFPVLIMGRGRQKIAVSVDDLLGEQDVMAKAMGPSLKRVRNVASFTMLGSGDLVPILHGPDVIRSGLAIKSGIKVKKTSHIPVEKVLKQILIAEDSLTSRMLLKNVLESSGYEVQTAVDGEDALEKMHDYTPDLIVSDVEMPKMNGFELTKRVRDDNSLQNVPIVLVTSLGSAADRAKGAMAGADAYIVKSSFDQGNLLEVIERLI